MPNAREEVAAIIFRSLENERCLDLRYKVIFGPLGNFLNYKVMKQAALRQRLGKLLTPALVAFAVTIPVILFGEWLRALFLSLSGYSPDIAGNTIWLVPTTPTNQALIRGAVAEDSSNSDMPVLNNFVRQLSARLGPWDIFHAGGALFLVLKKAIWAENRRVEMLLHSRDALALILLALYALRRDDDIFATDCHYQRWAFVLSHSAKNFYLVQHGELDDGIVFPHRFGHIQKAYIRDASTLKTLRCYYTVVSEMSLHYPAVYLETNAYAGTGVFIASSAPSLQEEIDFVLTLRAMRIVPIIVKLHPAHLYDSRRNTLLSTADHICASAEIPACCVFVSHNSSMELIYQRQGVPTVSIAKAGGVMQAVQQTIDILDNPRKSLKLTVKLPESVIPNDSISFT